MAPFLMENKKMTAAMITEQTQEMTGHPHKKKAIKNAEKKIET